MTTKRGRGDEGGFVESSAGDGGEVLPEARPVWAGGASGRYICSGCNYAESACRCPPDTVRSWVRVALARAAHYQFEADKALSGLYGHRLLPAEVALAHALEVDVQS